MAGLSFGHLSRCLILAKALRNSHQSDCLFVMKDRPEALPFATRLNVSTEIIPKTCKSENEFLLESVGAYRPDWVVIDLPYEDSFTYIEAVRSKGCSVLFIDDWRFRNPGADVYLNSSILSLDHFTNNENLTGHFLGPEYFIFDHSLIDPSVSLAENPIEITLSFGGADPTNLTARAVEILLANGPAGVAFNIILGPGYEHFRSVHERVKTQSAAFKILFNPDNVIPIFQRSSLVICAGGRTLYELIALGKRVLPIASTRFEADTVRRLLDLGWLRAGLTSWDSDKFTDLLLGFCTVGLRVPETHA